MICKKCIVRKKASRNRVPPKILLTESYYPNEEIPTRYGVIMFDEVTGERQEFLDVSTRRETLEKFVDRCVRYDLRFVHFADCLEDYLDEIFGIAFV